VLVVVIHVVMIHVRTVVFRLIQFRATLPRFFAVLALTLDRVLQLGFGVVNTFLTFFMVIVVGARG
jgi:hypothetical protein